MQVKDRGKATCRTRGEYGNSALMDNRDVNSHGRGRDTGCVGVQSAGNRFTSARSPLCHHLLCEVTLLRSVLGTCSGAQATRGRMQGERGAGVQHAGVCVWQALHRITYWTPSRTVTYCPLSSSCVLVHSDVPNAWQLGGIDVAEG